MIKIIKKSIKIDIKCVILGYIVHHKGDNITIIVPKSTKKPLLQHTKSAKMALKIFQPKNPKIILIQMVHRVFGTVNLQYPLTSFQGVKKNSNQKIHLLKAPRGSQRGRVYISWKFFLQTIKNLDFFDILLIFLTKYHITYDLIMYNIRCYIIL